jgi:hypothetical protein
MNLEYEITREDYFQAGRAVAGARPRPSWIHRAAPYLTFAAGFILMAKHDEVAGWLAPAGLMIAGLMWGLQPVWLAHAAAERAWNESRFARRPIHLTIDDDGLNVRTELRQSQVRWDAIDHFQETRDLFLLYLTPSELYTLIPKRSFPSGPQLDEFRALLAKKVRPANGAPVGRRGFEVITDHRSPPPSQPPTA